MIIIYKEFKNNKAEFTKKELEELLEKARKEGYDEGYIKGYSDGKYTPPLITPTSPTYPIAWVTNGTNSSINGTNSSIKGVE